MGIVRLGSVEFGGMLRCWRSSSIALLCTTWTLSPSRRVKGLGCLSRLDRVSKVNELHIIQHDFATSSSK